PSRRRTGRHRQRAHERQQRRRNIRRVARTQEQVLMSLDRHCEERKRRSNPYFGPSRWIASLGARNDSEPRYNRFFQIMSLAAIKPPPAINTAATAIAMLGRAKPASIRNAVDNSGVA